MRLYSWLIAILGLVALVVASTPWWPSSVGAHPPSYGEAAMLAVLGLGCLASLTVFARHDRRRRARKAAAERAAEVVHGVGLSKLIDDVVTSTATPCLKLTATRAEDELPPYASKLGGVFYAPPRFVWPMTTRQRPMQPLAQLNFAELPRLEDFPERGILQFFVTDDDVYGADFDNLTEQSGFRVIYHPDVEADSLPNPTLPAADSGEMPFSGEYRLTATATTMPITTSDWRFESVLLDSWERVTGGAEDADPQARRATYGALIEAVQNSDRLPFGGHLMGGYPSFIQEDPRDYRKELRGHSVLLLQIDSNDDICWGDAGVGNFFIEPDRLRRCDFSHVAYTWDCG